MSTHVPSIFMPFWGTLWLIMMHCSVVQLLLLRKVPVVRSIQSQRFATDVLKGIIQNHRVERIISNRGAGTRKECEQFIRRGVVVVNGEVITSKNDRCLSTEDVFVDGVCYPATKLLAVYHKPLGVLSSVGDTKNRPNLKDVMKKNPKLKGMHPVGRLDADSTGLLLFSSEGKLTNYLLNPTNKVDREYRAVVVGEVDFDKLKGRLLNGVETTDGKIRAKLVDSCEVTEEQKRLWFPNGIKVYHTEVKPLTEEEQDMEQLIQGGELELTLSGPMLLRQPLSVVNLTVVEGKYRMVRRILHNSGHSVVSLHRTRYGGIKLDPGRSSSSEGGLNSEGSANTIQQLSENEVRYLTADENKWLRKLIKG